ncbi:MAG: DUF4870 domain-containing protein [Planctomycetota bacterium]|nr:DUF4870 domain-containing protein [Planctomycetota bacterium]
MGLADEIRQLEQLHKDGVLDYGEFIAAKDALIKAAARAPSESPPASPPPESPLAAPPSSLPPASTEPAAPPYTAPPHTPRTEDELDAQTRQWGMFLHMSLLLGFLIPVLGLVVPILIWQLKRDEFPGIDPHGKNVMNWIISFFIYGVGSAILCMVIIGIPMLMALGVCGIIFPIIGGIKANDSEVWEYPLAIKFLN